MDFEDDNIGPKIKRGRLDRIPYLFIVGDNEVKDSTVTIRSRKHGDLGTFSADEAINRIVTENENKSLDN